MTVKFKEGDLDRIGKLAIQFKVMLMMAGIRTTDPMHLAALKLNIRLSEKILELGDQADELLTRALEGEDSLNLLQELEFIMADMERGH